jgi:hypothetical protein
MTDPQPERSIFAGGVERRHRDQLDVLIVGLLGEDEELLTMVPVTQLMGADRHVGPETGTWTGLDHDGYRFRAECRLAAKVYGARFGVDIVFGGVLSGDVEEIKTDDLLTFAGIAPPRLRVVPIETTSRRSSTRTRCRAIGRTPG